MIQPEKSLLMQSYIELLRNNVQADNVEKIVFNLENYLAMLGAFAYPNIEVSPHELIAKIKTELWKKYDLPAESKLLAKEPFFSSYQAFLREYASTLSMYVGYILGSLLRGSFKFELEFDVDFERK